MKYCFEIIETHKKVVEIDSTNIIDATNKVYAAYENKEIKLDEKDYYGVEINLINARYGKK